MSASSSVQWPGGAGRLASYPVARLGFGTMQLPGPGVWGPPRDRDTALAVLRRAVELGVNHIDTAQFYGNGVSNELIRAAGALGATPAQIGLAWLLGHDPYTLLIPGTSSLAHVEENLATTRVHLDPETMAVLDSLGGMEPHT
jgi:aryl-alcohol dehydrogenase-like predicted oxidoreductase